MQQTVSVRATSGKAHFAVPRRREGEQQKRSRIAGSHRARVVVPATQEDSQETMQQKQKQPVEAESEMTAVGDMSRELGLSEAEKKAERAAMKLASTFAPRPSGKVKNPATPGTVLYDVFGYQAAIGALAGALLSFNVLFPSDQPNIAKLLGMWSIWMFSIPSLRARECTLGEKDVLNILFLLLPLLNVLLPFLWKSFPFVFSADLMACVAVYYWKIGSRSSIKNKGYD